MNKLTSDQQILGHFVRIRTILRADPKAVKRRCIGKSSLPVKSAGCLMVRHSGMRLLGADPESSTVHRFWIPGSLARARARNDGSRNGALARLYANGIFAKALKRRLQRSDRTVTMSMTRS
jgi:hypothetical protein